MSAEKDANWLTHKLRDEVVVLLHNAVDVFCELLLLGRWFFSSSLIHLCKHTDICGVN